MKPSNLSRFKELYCVLFGHSFDEHYYEKEGPEETAFVLEEHSTCTNCELSTVDVSGRLQRYSEQHALSKDT